MKPNFALSLSFEGIGLLHRADGAGWHLLGEVALDNADLTGALAGLRDKAVALDAGVLACKVIIPDEQIKYLDLDADDAPADDVATLVANALDGATPYALNELAFDWVQTDTRVQVAAVARETLREAESFAREHRFNPVSFVARPDPDGFAGEPFFGPVGNSPEIERDDAPVTILPETNIPSTPRPGVIPAPPAAVVMPHDIVVPLAAAAPDKTETTPLPAFSSIRAERAASLTDAAPRLAGAARFTATADTATVLDVPRAGSAPYLNGAKASEINTDLTRETSAPTINSAALRPTGLAAAVALQSPADEAQRMTIFGARDAVRGRGKPRFLGLILTAILLVLLIGVAAWATISSETGLVRIFRAPEPQIAITPDLPEVIRPAEPLVPERARLQFQSDEKQHHHDAEFRHMLQFRGFMPAHQTQNGSDQNTGREIAQHRAEPKPRRDRHRDHGRPEVDRRLKQKSVHMGKSSGAVMAQAEPWQEISLSACSTPHHAHALYNAVHRR